jgi:DNA mismatch repair protein MutS2
VLEQAENAMPHAEREAERLLRELEEKERAMGDALADAANQRARAEKLRQEVEEREAALRTREREAERRARQQARDILLNAREEIEAAIREVREAVAADASTLEVAARAARRRVEERVRKEAERIPNEPSVRGQTDELHVGAAVRVSASGIEGVIVELRDDRATVEAGGLRMQVPAAGLALVAETKAEARKPRLHGGWSAPDLEVASEVDLRGLRADEVDGVLTPALDAAVLADLPSLRVIHGKGTGALRKVVTDLLHADTRVRSFRAGGFGEGGSGVTVVELR